MWKIIKQRLLRKGWSNRRIAFVSILIATSVAFIIVFANIAPVASIPSFKLIAGGLPVKLTGYIFGPIIGAMTGALSDLISFLMLPTFFHFYYTLAWVAAGLIPGVIGYFFNRRWKPRREVQEKFESKKNLLNFIATMLILLLIGIGLFIFVWFAKPEKIESKLITDRIVFLGIALAGMSTMFIALVIFWFVLKPKTFNAVLPIIAFSALLEIVATPLLTLGDLATIAKGSTDSFVTIMAGHMILSPVKIWGNMIVILIAYRIISPLIYNKQNNGWIED